MASDKSVVETIVQNIRNAGNIRFLKMFGEYTIYCDEKNKTHSSRENFIGKVMEVQPYPGAKSYVLIKDQ